MLSKTNLRQFARIVGIIILAIVCLKMFVFTMQGDQEYLEQEQMLSETVYQPKVKHFYSN